MLTSDPAGRVGGVTVEWAGEERMEEGGIDGSPCLRDETMIPESSTSRLAEEVVEGSGLVTMAIRSCDTEFTSFT